MSNPNPVRVSAGTPEGGRFAPDPRAESAVALDATVTEPDAEDARLNAVLAADIAAYQAANSRIQLLSAKLAARAILRHHPEATHLSLEYSDQTMGEMVPNEVLDANGDAIDDPDLFNALEDDEDISGLVGNLTEYGDWTVCRDYATDRDRHFMGNPRLNLAAAAALDTDQIAASTGITTVSQEAMQAPPAPVVTEPVDAPPTSPFETSAVHRTGKWADVLGNARPPVYKERSQDYRAAMRSAQAHLGRFREGDVVVVTGENGTQHFARIIRDRRSDGEFGSPESRTLGASLGLGKYTFDVTSHKLAMGSVGMRAIRADELAAANDQFEAAHAANLVRQQERIDRANVKLTEVGLPQVGEEAVAWPDSDFPVHGRIHDISADGRSVSMVLDGKPGTSLYPIDVMKADAK